MPDVDLQAIRTRVEAATPGPWRVEWVEADNWYVVYGQPHDGMVCPEVATLEDGGGDEAEFIAAARTDIPALLAEVERLTHLLGSHSDGHRCTCTTLCGIQRDSSGAPVSPPEWEQDPWCPTHPDVDQIRAEFDRLRGLLAEAEHGRDRANQRLGNLTISLNDSLAPEILRQKAEAWDEGADAGWEKAVTPDSSNPANPYRGQS